MGDKNKCLAILDCENCDMRATRGILDIDDLDVILIQGRLQDCAKIKIHIENNIAYDLVSNKRFNCSTVTAYRCEYSCKNAADFLLAYTLGKYIAKNKYDNIFIISEDKALCTIVGYVKENNISIEALNFTQANSSQIYIRKAIERLSKLKSGISLRALVQDINKIYNNLDDTNYVINQLNNLGIIKIRLSKVNQVYYRKELIQRFIK